RRRGNPNGPVPGAFQATALRSEPQSVEMHLIGGRMAMPKLAIWAQMEAKAGKEREVADFLKSAKALAEKEEGTVTWYAMRLGGSGFGIFDTFADEKGREAH